jgi:hypothetical protein
MLLAFALAPLLVTLDSWEGWKTIAAQQNWQWMAYEKDACSDGAVKELETLIRSRKEVDPDRVYLAGRGDVSPCVFYVVSRAPDLWGAALAIEGNPRRAIETNRLFSANLSMTPVLWAAHPDPHRRKIPGVMERAEITTEEAVAFLASRRRLAYPLRVDYETGNPNFLRCFWIEIAKPDPARRNDALPVSRVQPGSGAYLALGGFGYDPAKPGPGVEVAWLPPKYSGPLKIGDRILAVAGREIASGWDYAQYMDEVREEKSVAVMIQRGNQKIRLETRIMLPQREEGLTIRFQAEVQPESKEILLITRGIAALRLTLPAAWAPATVNWNGPTAVILGAPGCHLLSADPAGKVTTGPCP